jgi:hypothetical protein
MKLTYSGGWMCVEILSLITTLRVTTPVDREYPKFVSGNIRTFAPNSRFIRVYAQKLLRYVRLPAEMMSVNLVAAGWAGSKSRRAPARQYNLLAGAAQQVRT